MYQTLIAQESANVRDILPMPKTNILFTNNFVMHTYYLVSREDLWTHHIIDNSVVGSLESSKKDLAA